MERKARARHLFKLVGSTLASFIFVVSCGGNAPTPTATTTSQPGSTAAATTQQQPTATATPAVQPQSTATVAAQPKSTTTTSAQVAESTKTGATSAAQSKQIDAAPKATATSEPQPIEELVQCPSPSDAFLETLADGLKESGKSSLTKAQALHINMAGTTTAEWFLVGALIKGQGTGKDTIGLWATTIEPTADEVSPGMIVSVNEAAEQFSTWPPPSAMASRFASTDPDIRLIQACVKSAD